MSSKSVAQRYTKKKATRNRENYLSRQGKFDGWLEKLKKRKLE